MRAATKKKLLVAGGVVAGAGLLYLFLRPGADDQDIQPVVDFAFLHETNKAVLYEFAAKLQDAGYTSEASKLIQKANSLS